MSELLNRALAYLGAHQDSSAREIAAGIGMGDERAVHRVLLTASHRGTCQRWKARRDGPWLWDLPGVDHDCKAGAL